MLSNLDTSFPSGRGFITPAAATVAEILRDRGFNTLCVGKWHLAPTEHTSAAGPYDQWPLGRGFERFYGFLEAETDCFYPELTYDNHAVEPPATPQQGYHLTTDLIDRAIGFIRDQTSVTPEKPFFLQLAFATAHAPHQAPAELLAKYRGAYARGWDVVRAERHARQIEQGLVPAGTRLAPRNAGVMPWADLSGRTRRRKGWKAVAYHQRGTPYADDVWELYNLDEDWSECHDLAQAQPEKLAEMVERFWAEAGRYDVLPLDDRGYALRARVPRPGSPRARSRFTYYPGMAHLPMAVTPATMNRAHCITAILAEPVGQHAGVLVALGGVSSGYVLYLKDGHLCYEYNYIGQRYRIRSADPVPADATVFKFAFDKTGDRQGIGRLMVGETEVGATAFPAVLPYFHGWHGLDIGRDGLSPMSADYDGAFPFSGSINRIVYDLASSEDTLLFEPVD